jgi:hypothetical protein
MISRWAFITVGLGGFGILIWASDSITLQGERTIYTVSCERGVWNGLRCTGRLAAGDRYRFRSSRSRNEVVYWIAGSNAPSGKYTACQVKNRDNWACKVQPGQPPSITHQLSNGRPVSQGAGVTHPFFAVAKWKWWALHAGIPVSTHADFGSSSNPPLPGGEAR